jgi:membrane protein implicated in regulation of membrane protease activity
METCCPNCGTANAAGTAAVNVCTECVAVNILGLSLPMAGGIAAALAVIAVVLVRRWLQRPRAPRTAAVLA